MYFINTTNEKTLVTMSRVMQEITETQMSLLVKIGELLQQGISNDPVKVTEFKQLNQTIDELRCLLNSLSVMVKCSLPQYKVDKVTFELLEKYKPTIKPIFFILLAIFTRRSPSPLLSVTTEIENDHEFDDDVEPAEQSIGDDESSHEEAPHQNFSDKPEKSREEIMSMFQNKMKSDSLANRIRTVQTARNFVRLNKTSPN
jgi:hypothetical protein